MPIEVIIKFEYGKWHIHGKNDGKCYGAFERQINAINAANAQIHNFKIISIINKT